VPPQEGGAYEAKGAEWETNKRSVTANFPLHQKNVLLLDATISSKIYQKPISGHLT